MPQKNWNSLHCCYQVEVAILAPFPSLCFILFYSLLCSINILHHYTPSIFSITILYSINIPIAIVQLQLQVSLNMTTINLLSAVSEKYLLFRIRNTDSLSFHWEFYSFKNQYSQLLSCICLRALMPAFSSLYCAYGCTLDLN